jgi:hypothetical protein
MVLKKPTFYLVPLESVPIVYPAKCWIQRKLECLKGDYVLVKVSPPILRWESAECKRILEIEEVIITARYLGKTLADIQNGAVYVNIFKLKSPQKHMCYELINDDLELFALGVILTSEKMAWKETRRAFETRSENYLITDN